jgi:hydrogenase maturation protease
VRVLIGGVGYRDLCDHSFGVRLVDALAADRWPPDVAVEDLSYGPVAVVQRLEDDAPEDRFDLAIFAGATERGRVPGTLDVYRWDKALPGPSGIQSAIAEAVTGVIALENTLIVARHFNALPGEVVVIEVEPELHAFGDVMSGAVIRALEHARGVVTVLALDPPSAGRLPLLPLGGGWIANLRTNTQAGHVRLRIS